jgi:ABC-type nickel/cobalt efflux system permease component RcnA
MGKRLMLGIDNSIAQLGGGQTLLVVLAVALLLGLRHATDPDHLAAVSTLIASEPEDGTRRAARLGLAWGLGHASTLFAFGLPIVLFNSYLPEPAQDAAELIVGLVIVALAIRLLARWRRGRYHAHLHRHGELEHRHLHPHERGPQHSHRHAPEVRLGRSPRQAYAIGLLHGMGGSAGVGVLLLAGIPRRGEAAAALILFAVAAAVSMAMLSSAFGFALTRGPVMRRLLALAPGLGFATLAFGVWYSLGATGAVPYPL